MMANRARWFVASLALGMLVSLLARDTLAADKPKAEPAQGVPDAVPLTPFTPSEKDRPAFKLVSTWNAYAAVQILVMDFDHKRYKADDKRAPVEEGAADSPQVIEDVSNHNCDVGLTFDSFIEDKDRKFARSVKNATIARYVVAVGVNANSPTRSITLQELSDVYHWDLLKGGITSWKGVKNSGSREKIDLYRPEEFRVVTEVFRKRLAMEAPFTDAMFYSPVAPPAARPTDQQVIEEIGRRPNAIGFFQYTYDMPLDPRVRILALAKDEHSAAVAPTPKTVFDGTYPLADSLSIYLHPDAPAVAKDFCKIAAGAEGAKVLEEDGFWPDYLLKQKRPAQPAAPQADKRSAPPASQNPGGAPAEGKSAAAADRHDPNAGPWIANSMGMKLALIPAGEFMMGSPQDEQRSIAGSVGNWDPERQHRVRITHPFYLGATTITQDEYQQVMGTNPSYFSATGEGKDLVAGLNTSRFPVEQVTWPQAQEFCLRLSIKEGKKYRLPTEAEWEYACRAGTKTAFNFGKSITSAQANFDAKIPFGREVEGNYLERPTTVGSYPPNAFGLYDMHGNVWQWCADRWDYQYYDKSPPADDPRGPEKAEDVQGAEKGQDRVIRGGSWGRDPTYCRSARREGVQFELDSYMIGFRIVREP